MEMISCNICGSKESDLLFSQRDLMFGKDETLFNVVKCRTCGLMFTNPRPTEEEMSLYYPDEYYYIPGNERGYASSLVKLYNNLKNEMLIRFYGYDPLGKKRGESEIVDYFYRCIHLVFKLLRKNISLFPFKEDGNLLDVGCGSGSTLLYWQKMGWSTYGVEIGKAAVAFARGKMNLDVFEGTLFEAKYLRNFFDVIMFNNTLEHMHNPTKMLREASRILKDEGLLMISVPNTECIDSRVCGRWWCPWDVPRHLYHFTREAIERLLRKSGFYPVKMISDFVPRNALLNLSFYLKQCLNMELYPKLLLPLAIPWAYFGQGNILFIHAKKLAGKQ